jgi:uncharacterized membrane protein (UPF0127 family)
MAKLKVRNVTRSSVLATEASIADTSAARCVGLLRHDSLPPGHGLWIVPSEGIHTFGMKFAIDVIFLGRKKNVLKVRRRMGPRRLSLCLWAHSVLELPAGTLEATGTGRGDQLEFEHVPETN